MSGTVNIRRDVKDAFYRYKMPKIQSKIEGKGNGIKTVISNMTEVAKALNRPPTYVTKFFGNELGSIVHCDDKTSRYIVNGAHDAEKLQTLLDSFIAKFVLCQACDNPETDLTVSAGRDGTVLRNCKACGHRGPVDMGHKLVTFIQKNPPAKPRKIKQAGDAAGDVDGEGEGAEGGADNAHDEDGEGEGMVAPSNLESSFDNLSPGATDRFDNDDWADTTDLRDAELEGLSRQVKRSLKVKDDAAALDAFADWLQSASHPDADIVAHVKRGMKQDKAVAVAVQVLLDDAKESVPVLFTRRLALFGKLIDGDGKAQRAFLGALERVVGLHRPDQLRHLPALLQAAYNEDVVDEEALLDWHAKPSKRYMSDPQVAEGVRKTTEKFIEWLKADEGDSEESGEDDSEDEE